MKKDSFVKAKIVSIGDELLLGQVVNTNSSWLGEQLNVNGIEVVEVLTIGDGADDITEALNACSDVDIVVMTGGLGPTADDITKPTLCKYFGTTLELNEDALENVKEIFRLRGYQMSERNMQQAYVPKSCTYIPNRYGTAPCMWFEKGKTVYISMPGVPFEMKSVFATEIMPRLKTHFQITPYARRVIMTTGIGESFLADKIKDWEEALPEFLSLAYLPQYGVVRLRLDGRHPDEAYINKVLDEEVRKLKDLIAENIFGFDDEPIAEVVLKIMKARNLTLSTAESCTGGAVAKMITSIPGSSAVYKGSVVAYSPEIKEKVLGVSHETIEKHNVVSKEVVESMALGVQTLMRTDYAVATTGIAGPDGGTEETPVGTVWIAVATPTGVVSKINNFGKDRGNNIERTAITVLEMLRKELNNK